MKSNFRYGSSFDDIAAIIFTWNGNEVVKESKILY